MKSLIPHHVQGYLVHQNTPDGYFNATELCQAAGKLFADYSRLSTTKAYLRELSLDMGIPITELIQQVRGGFPQHQGTWVHPRVAIHLAQWLSAKFAVRVTGLIADWVQGFPQHNTLTPLLDVVQHDWQKRFPDEFYREIYRLHRWPWPGMAKNRYQVVGHYTNELVWDRIAPGLREEIRHRFPEMESQNRPVKYHQILTEQVGVPVLRAHIYGLLMLMRASSDWDRFIVSINISLPKPNQSLAFPFSPP